VSLRSVLADSSWSAALADIVTELERTDLRPGPVVDVLFSRLVALAFDLPADDPVLGREPLVAQVRDLASRGECELEAHWAARVRSDPRVLRDFPFLWNYLRLARGEWQAVRTAGRRPRALAFVGSGPLPLSALTLHRLAPEVEVTCIDRDPAAVALGRGVARSVGADVSGVGGESGVGGVRFVAAEAADLDYAPFDVVVVAALVGATVPGKGAVLDRIASSLRPGAVLAVRSVPADGRRLLYPRVEVRDLPSAVRPVGEWLPPSGVVNSLQLGVAG
jgi:SAM-dependent methyltransferase